MARTLPLVISEGSVQHRTLRALVPPAIVVLVIAVPYLLRTFQLGQVTHALILATAVVGLNLLSGFGGQISLGHAAFFGLGAYTTAVLTTGYGWNVPLSFVLGVVLCVVAGMLIGVPALRLRGGYLAIVTLTVGIIFPNLVRRFEGLTGGSAGLYGVKYPAPDIPYFSGTAGAAVWLYYVAVAVLALSWLVVWRVMRGRIGRAIVALRDNESAAIVMGVNRAFVRTVTFGISAGIAGLAGGVYAVKVGVLTPDSFALLLTIELLIAMVLGGKATHFGPVFGGFLIYFIPHWTSEAGQGPVAGVLFGIVVIIMVFVLPEGIVGGLARVRRRFVVVVPRRPPVAGQKPVETIGNSRSTEKDSVHVD